MLLFRMILSNSDATYLDCGYAGWVTDGNNWCSPYKGWQGGHLPIQDHDRKIFKDFFRICTAITHMT